MSQDKLNNAKDGWIVATISITPADLPDGPAKRRLQLYHPLDTTVEFSHRHMLHFLEAENSKQDYQNHFAVLAAPVYKEGMRVLGGAVHEAGVWEEAQKEFRVKHPGAVVAALQLYSDKTQLTLKGTRSVYTIRACLLNVSYGKRLLNVQVR